MVMQMKFSSGKSKQRISKRRRKRRMEYREFTARLVSGVRKKERVKWMRKFPEVSFRKITNSRKIRKWIQIQTIKKVSRKRQIGGRNGNSG